MKTTSVFQSFVLIAAIVYGTSSQASHNSGGSSTSGASLSTDTVSLSVGENGSWTISGNDGGSQREFRWSLPSGLSVSAGSSSNMNRFRVRSDRGYFQAETNGGGAFSTTGCECGCELTNVHSALNHYMRDIALAKNEKAVDDYWNRTQLMLQKAIKSHEKAKKPNYKSFRLYRKPKVDNGS